ncbi:MAG TPA: hypothetical protein VLV83_16865 [Acidobacteriota bacterium]|nr:hypothetical protein [Acidobacteriota bacterium]
MADCNKLKKKWVVDTSDTDVFVPGCRYKIEKAKEDLEEYTIEFLELPPPNPDGFSTLVCETSHDDDDVLVGTYTDTEDNTYRVLMALADDKHMQGEVGDAVVEAKKGRPDDDPAGTWGAEEEPPAKGKDKEEEKKKKDD